MSRAALVADGLPAFLDFLVFALVLSMFAVIRTPPWDGTSSDDSEAASARPAPDQRAPAHPRAAHARPAHVRAAPMPAGARPRPQTGTPLAASRAAGPDGQTGQPDAEAGSAAGPVPGRGRVRAPKVSGAPPWEPAPRPPGPMTPPPP